MKPKTKKIVGTAAIMAGVAALTAGVAYAQKNGLDKKTIAKIQELQKKAKHEYINLEKKLVKEYNELIEKLPINKKTKVINKKTKK